jgi:alpha-L-fucosidase
MTPIRKRAGYTPVKGRYYWEAIPTTNKSYGYHREDDSHKPPSHFIVLLSKAAAKGGNLLMNVGPKGDGTIDVRDQKILKGIGAWLSVNGEAIYGTRETPLPVPSWGQTSVKGNKLYLHVHSDPGEVLALGGLKNKVNSAYLLADPDKKPLAVERAESGDYQIGVPDGSLNEAVSIIVLECDGAIERANTTRLLAHEQTNILHVFDGEENGKGIRYGAGNHRSNHIHSWRNENANIYWDCRLTADATFNVYAEYDAGIADEKNRYEIDFGTEALSAKVVPQSKFERRLVGQVSLKKGDIPITVNALEIAPKTNLMNLRRLILEPVSLNASVN